MKRTDFLRLLTLVVMACLAWSCSTDEQLDSLKTEEGTGWLKDIDPNQTWMTSTNVRLNIVAQKGATVTATTIGNNKSIILGEKVLKGNGVMNLDMPQGVGQRFGIVYDDGTGNRQYKTVTVSGENTQIEDVRFNTGNSAMSRAAQSEMVSRGAESVSRAATNSSLYGNSILPDCGYTNFGSWAWEDISKALVETADASKNYVSLIDYDIMAQGELSSKGTFVAQETVIVSFLYGYTGQTGSRTLGYFVHNGNYDDFEWHDISEVLTKDYLNNKAKVQYQLDGKDVWYDANFDYKDDPSSATSANVAARRNDDAYNVLNLYNYYGNRITAVRGLSFKLEIPKGKVFGFYLRSNETISEGQKSKLSALGVSDANMPKYKANYSKAEMNYSGVAYRSALAIYDNFTFMGIDDNLDNGGDKDCNDVTFALSNVSGSKFLPTFTESTKESSLNNNTITQNPEYKVDPVKPQDPAETGGNSGSGETEDVTSMPSAETIKDKYQRWTLCFEDGETNLDFDFNDIVLHVAPITKINKVAVWLMAAGGQRHTEIWYNNGNEDIYLGEAHNLFGVGTNVMVNTQPGTKEYQAVLLSGTEGLDWPEGSNVEAGRQRFFIKVYDYEGKKVENVIYGNSTVNTDKGNNVPEAICVQGEWEWPLENVSVHDAYPLMGKWGSQLSNQEYWNWYSQPTPEKTKKWWQWWK